jgi:hypothetical protein
MYTNANLETEQKKGALTPYVRFGYNSTGSTWVYYDDYVEEIQWTEQPYSTRIVVRLNNALGTFDSIDFKNKKIRVSFGAVVTGGSGTSQDRAYGWCYKQEYVSSSGIDECILYGKGAWDKLEDWVADTDYTYSTNTIEEVIDIIIQKAGLSALTSASTTTTFNPDSGAVDGNVWQRELGGVTWATLQGEAGNGSTDSATTITIILESHADSSKWKELGRGIYCFDTSSIPASATVTAATFTVYGYNKGDALSITPDINIVSAAPASTTALVDGDFDSLGTTAYCDTAISYANFDVTGFKGQNDFVLNATGRAAIDDAGVTKIGIRNMNYDADDVEPSWSSDEISQFTLYAVDSTTEGTDPALSVTYDPFDGKIDSWTPAYTVKSQETALVTVLRLLSITKCVLVPREDTFILKYPQAGDATDYTYVSDAVHYFSRAKKADSTFKPMKVTVTNSVGNTGTATHTDWTSDMGVLTYVETEGVTSSNADCQVYAEAILDRAERESLTGYVKPKMMNCLQELYDKVTVTDNRGNVGATARVGRLDFNYKVSGGQEIYTQDIRLGGAQSLGGEPWEEYVPPTDIPDEEPPEEKKKPPVDMNRLALWWEDYWKKQRKPIRRTKRW